VSPEGEVDPTGLAAWATDVLVDVGPLALRIVSDVPDFPATNYFSSAVRTAVLAGGPPREPDAEVWCVSTRDAPAHWPSDRSTRALGFLKGYYVTDHAGPPVRMVSSGRQIVLFGPQLERIVWSYVVKWLLTQHAVASGALFLKAAAVAIDGQGVLVIGRGGAGKTVMISELCRQGARFVTNSHAVVTGTSVQGVATSMRMRPGPWVDQLGVRPRRALDPREVVVDPAEAFGGLTSDPVPLRHVALVDFQGQGQHRVERLTPPEALSVLEQFALGLNVYRLEEDLLEAAGGDYRSFAASYAAMQERLRELVEACPCHSVVTDVQRPESVTALRKLWCAP